MITYSSANENVFILGLNRADFQKESFWPSKRVLLECKRSPFSIQKEPFCIANVVLLQNKKITYASQKGCTVISHEANRLSIKSLQRCFTSLYLLELCAALLATPFENVVLVERTYIVKPLE